MDINQVAALIGSLGFPIVMCGTLCFFIYKTQTKLQDIINENTKNLEKLIDRLDRIIKSSPSSKS